MYKLSHAERRNVCLVASLWFPFQSQWAFRLVFSSHYHLGPKSSSKFGDSTIPPQPTTFSPMEWPIYLKLQVFPRSNARCGPPTAIGNSEHCRSTWTQHPVLTACTCFQKIWRSEKNYSVNLLEKYCCRCKQSVKISLLYTLPNDPNYIFWNSMIIFIIIREKNNVW